jgi:hypothetical protein
MYALSWKGRVKFMKCFKGGATYKSLGTSSIGIKNFEGINIQKHTHSKVI